MPNFAKLKVSMEDRHQHFVGNVAQKAIIEKEGKILVCKGIGDSVWEFPGGRLHAGETPREGLAREIREELGVSIKIGAPVDIIRSFHGQTKQWQVFTAYKCTLTDASDIVMDKEELEELKWVTKEELKVLPMFDDCRSVGKTLVLS